MNRFLLAGVILSIIVGCSDRQDDIEPKEVKVKNIEKNVTKIEKKSIDIDRNLTTREDAVVETPKEDFIPEHIRRSHIEVVKHY